MNLVCSYIIHEFGFCLLVFQLLYQICKCFISCLYVLILFCMLLMMNV